MQSNNIRAAAPVVVRVGVRIGVAAKAVAALHVSMGPHIFIRLCLLEHYKGASACFFYYI